MLQGSSAGGHVGLIVLFREGMAAWAHHWRPRDAAASAQTRFRVQQATGTVPTPEVGDPQRAELIRVLANLIVPTLTSAMETPP